MQLTGCKVDYIVDFARDQLAKGYCIVIGLQSTGNCRSPLFPCATRVQAPTSWCVLTLQSTLCESIRCSVATVI